MVSLQFENHRNAPDRWAEALGITREAVELYLDCEVIDLHIDSFIWHRIFGYDLTKRHGRGLLGARFYSQADFPRVLEAQLAGATWVITTNPFRAAVERESSFRANIADFLAVFEQAHAHVQVVRTLSEYRTARAAGKHAAFVGLQGGNALDRTPFSLDLIPDDVVLRITLVHLSTSTLGSTSSPLRLGKDFGLSKSGHGYVEALNAKRIFVDLAHISKKGFWDALAVHDKTQPFLVTHTGISGAFEHWRNLDDDQVRAVAKQGGTIGIMYQSSFLGDPYLGGSAARIVDHMDHVIKLVGDEHVSLGSDWDGAILPPRDMPTCLELPRLVQIMLDRGYQPGRVRRILGANFLRVLGELRP